MNRRKFITTCACCSLASFGAGFINNLYNSDNCKVKLIQIHIAEHCNLGCKYCSHFSCIAQKEFYDLDKFQQDIKQTSFIFNQKLKNILLLGGEPLLNPQINEYVKASRKYFPNTRIDIVTNAVLLDDMDESFWKTLNENNAHIVPSVYPIKINWNSILKKAKKYNVGMYKDVIKKEKITSDNIKKSEVKTFCKINLSKNNTVATKTNCRKQFLCTSMQDGKLYPCMVIAYIRHLNKRFNTNFIVSEGDYLDLYKAKSIDDVIRFSQTSVLPFCRYCNETYKVKWENSKEHTLSEWT